MEAEATARAAQIGDTTGLFYTPRVIRFDAAHSYLDTERLEGLEQVLELALNQDPILPSILNRAGLALAAVHSALALPSAMRIPLVKTDAPNHGVFLHGDFTAQNVCYQRSLDRLVIVDWSSAPYFEAPFSFGPLYFDVIWFTYFFYNNRPLLRLGGWDPSGWARSFLAGYSSHSQSSFNIVEFRFWRAKLAPALRGITSRAIRKRTLARRVAHLLNFPFMWGQWQLARFGIPASTLR